MKQSKIPIWIVVAVTVVLLLTAIILAVFDNKESPDNPTNTDETTTAETTESQASAVTDAGTIDLPKPPETGTRETVTETAGIVVDVSKANEGYERPSVPTIEGEPFTIDGYKEVPHDEME